MKMQGYTPAMLDKSQYCRRLHRLSDFLHWVSNSKAGQALLTTSWILFLYRYVNVYIKKASPHLNGKVERSHLTDQQEFYQPLEYTDDIDIGKKLKEWEKFYNCYRPNGALKEKTPYKVLREKLIPT